jgi:hypothetical protein
VFPPSRSRSSTFVPVACHVACLGRELFNVQRGEIGSLLDIKAFLFATIQDLLRLVGDVCKLHRFPISSAWTLGSLCTRPAAAFDSSTPLIEKQISPRTIFDTLLPRVLPRDIYAWYSSGEAPVPPRVRYSDSETSEDAQV